MDLKLSMEQLREIVRLARKCQESTPTGWVTAQEILNHKTNAANEEQVG